MIELDPEEPVDLSGWETSQQQVSIEVTWRVYYDLDGNEVDFVTWLQIHAPELAEAYGLENWRPHVE